jgi:hypothetical protein
LNTKTQIGHNLISLASNYQIPVATASRAESQREALVQNGFGKA